MLALGLATNKGERKCHIVSMRWRRGICNTVARISVQYPRKNNQLPDRTINKKQPNRTPRLTAGASPIGTPLPRNTPIAAADIPPAPYTVKNTKRERHNPFASISARPGATKSQAGRHTASVETAGVAMSHLPCQVQCIAMGSAISIAPRAVSPADAVTAKINTYRPSIHIISECLRILWAPH
jgi:hypothetical protein